MFSDKISFRWCFYINLPIGFVTVVVLGFFFKPPPGIGRGGPTTIAKRLRKLDPLGTVLFLPAIVSILLALQWAGTKYAWTNPRILALITVFVVLITGFEWLEGSFSPCEALPIVGHLGLSLSCSQMSPEASASLSLSLPLLPLPPLSSLLSLTFLSLF